LKLGNKLRQLHQYLIKLQNKISHNISLYYKMKSTTLALLFSLFFSSLLAQNNEVAEFRKYPNSSIHFNWASYSLAKTPKDFKLSPWSMAVDVYGMFTLLGRETFVSMAIGTGLSVQNMKSNSQLIEADTSYFVPLPEQINYFSNKMTTVFVSVPFELRLRTRPKVPKTGYVARKRNLRWAIGTKFSYVIQSYIKYSGDDFSNPNGGGIKRKQYNIKNLMPYQVGVYSSLGFGKFSFYAYYVLSEVFMPQKGPVLKPFSLGLSITI